MAVLCVCVCVCFSITSPSLSLQEKTKCQRVIKYHEGVSQAPRQGLTCNPHVKN